MLRIYNEGIASGLTTFEWELRQRKADIERWFGARYPFFVAAPEDGGEALAFAVTGAYSTRPCYAGIADFSVYVDSRARGQGLGGSVLVATMQRLGSWGSISSSDGCFRITRRVCGCWRSWDFATWVHTNVMDRCVESGRMWSW